MPRVLMNSQQHNDWVVHFATEQELRAFASRWNLEDPAGFEHSLEQWSRGSTYANLTDGQYSKLRREG
jgi:hypothetical protein